MRSDFGWVVKDCDDTGPPGRWFFCVYFDYSRLGWFYALVCYWFIAVYEFCLDMLFAWFSPFL
jgi:hypothetical protein